ncbi:hypothetical protein ACSD7O_24035 [Methylorubrum extorquens]|uniref:hypothetical protein n=1 Tax=Methylorubrum extorquens TaxID=408 RepID=UPI003F63890D
MICSLLGSRAYRTHEVHFDQAAAEARRDQMQAQYDADPAMMPNTFMMTNLETGETRDRSGPPSRLHVAFFVSEATAPSPPAAGG